MHKLHSFKKKRGGGVTLQNILFKKLVKDVNWKLLLKKIITHN